MESVLVHNVSVQAKVQGSSTTNTAKPLGFRSRVPAILFNLLTCVVVPLFTVTTFNHWLLWLVRKAAMAVNVNCFNFLGLWTCPPLFKYWKRCQYFGTHYALGRISCWSKMHAVGSIPLQSAVAYARLYRPQSFDPTWRCTFMNWSLMDFSVVHRSAAISSLFLNETNIFALSKTFTVVLCRLSM